MTEQDIDRLLPVADRLQESHFFLHGLEDFYHFASPFRWHLNAFLRSLKEVPQLIEMALQNRLGFPEWYKVPRAVLAADPLIQYLRKQRDFVVHRGMLKPHSHAFIGITEGRRMKLGLGQTFDPLSDSDDAIRRYLEVSKHRGDFLGILEEDEDSLPAVERHWRLEQFGDLDLVEVCVAAWHLVAEHVNTVAVYLGDEGSTPRLDCRHDLDKVRIRAYDRDELRKGIVEGFRLR